MIHPPNLRSTAWPRTGLLLALALATAGASGISAGAEVPLSFSKTIAPIFVAKCVACHGSEKTKGGYQLHTYEALRKAGESKEASVTPGQPARSKVFQLITTADPEDRMPQKDDALPSAQIALIERWSTEGAVFDGTPGRFGEVRLIEPDGSNPRVLARTTDMMLALAFSTDGKRLVAGGADNVIRVFTVATGREELRLELHADWVMGLAFSPDGSQLASASRDKSGRLIDATTGELEQTYLGHGDAVFGVAFSGDGKRVFSAGRDKQIHLWQAADAKLVEQMKDFEGEVLKVLVHDDRLFSVSADRKARLFVREGKKYQLTRTLSGHGDTVYALALHASSGRLATGGYDGEVRLWDVETGALLRAFMAAPGYRHGPTARAKDF